MTKYVQTYITAEHITDAIFILLLRCFRGFGMDTGDGFPFGQEQTDGQPRVSEGLLSPCIRLRGAPYIRWPYYTG
ncbi:hypothetical protein DESC_790066 [Desulfosarcina cetonica]|nr:hypothetical protein DESC_790066 [Desulfosarcina cetonica]